MGGSGPLSQPSGWKNGMEFCSITVEVSTPLAHSLWGALTHLKNIRNSEILPEGLKVDFARGRQGSPTYLGSLRSAQRPAYPRECPHP